MDRELAATMSLVPAHRDGLSALWNDEVAAYRAHRWSPQWSPFLPGAGLRTDHWRVCRDSEMATEDLSGG